MEANWSDFKTFAVSRNLSIQWVVVGANYYLKAFDNAFSLECLITTDNTICADTVDFETNFKANGNKSPIQSVSVQTHTSFSAKTFGTKKIYARNTGMQFTLSAGSNTLTYTAAIPWAKITGVEIMGAETLDYVDFKVRDSATGSYSGVANYLLNQFGFSVNMAKDYYKREATFDADLYAGMVLEFVYTSISAKNIAINLIMSEVK